METGSQQACGAVAEALGVEQEDEEYDSKTLTHTYMAAQFDDDDTRMKLIDLHMKQISDSIQNDITKYVISCYVFIFEITSDYIIILCIYSSTMYI